MAQIKESRVQLILDDLETTIAGIRKADGYWHDAGSENVTQEERPLDVIKTAEKPYAEISAGDENRLGEASMPRNVSNLLEVEIFVVVKPDDPAEKRRWLERWIQDIRKKLQVDTHRSGNARYTFIESVERDRGELGFQDQAAARITLGIRIDHPWAQP